MISGILWRMQRMNLKPLVRNRLFFKSFGLIFDLELKTNLTFINSVSGEGKTFVFEKIKRWASDKEDIACFDYTDRKNGIVKEFIRTQKNKLIAIDNADILLDAEDRKYIALDVNNQYIIIGRVVENLMLTKENMCSVEFLKDEDTIRLQYY